MLWTLIIEKIYSLGLCRYVRILGAFYLRLTGSDVDVYRYLEPLYNDYRKVRQKLSDGSKFHFLSKDPLYLTLSDLFSYQFYFPWVGIGFSLTHVDEVIEELLTKDYSCDIAMPRLKKRFVLFTFGYSWILAFGFCSIVRWLICHCDDRWTLEQNGLLEPRKSVLEDDFEEEEEKEENEGIADISEDEKVTAFILR